MLRKWVAFATPSGAATTNIHILVAVNCVLCLPWGWGMPADHMITNNPSDRFSKSSSSDAPPLGFCDTTASTYTIFPNQPVTCTDKWFYIVCKRMRCHSIHRIGQPSTTRYRYHWRHHRFSSMFLAASHWWHAQGYSCVLSRIQQPLVVYHHFARCLS